ncbi:uncharacterized protein LOC124675554 isoform X2 [Lolium rigidum]|uniref:uncharacterized protein LOC124675554 isoform X2 n=1 Tax=Lolium rigidum TaxID=89674 RepID=UPI001F5DBCD3|nr:uncharacterized protein LOC124675554 isoform X2 [Lolium rigidum]
MDLQPSLSCSILPSNESSTSALIHLPVLVEDVQNMKSELTNLEVKLKEAEKLIMKLREEARTTIQKQDKFRHEMEFYARTRRFMPRWAGIRTIYGSCIETTFSWICEGQCRCCFQR